MEHEGAGKARCEYLAACRTIRYCHQGSTEFTFFSTTFSMTSLHCPAESVAWKRRVTSRVKYSGLEAKFLPVAGADCRICVTGPMTGVTTSRQPPLAMPHRADATMAETGATDPFVLISFRKFPFPDFLFSWWKNSKIISEQLKNDSLQKSSLYFTIPTTSISNFLNLTIFQWKWKSLFDENQTMKI